MPDLINSLLATPRTRLGWYSLVCAILFFLLFAVWLLYISSTPIARPTFFSDPVHAVLILAAAASAIIGAVLGLLALLLKNERSVLVVFSVALGGLVLFSTIAEWMGH